MYRRLGIFRVTFSLLFAEHRTTLVVSVFISLSLVFANMLKCDYQTVPCIFQRTILSIPLLSISFSVTFPKWANLKKTKLHFAAKLCIMFCVSLTFAFSVISPGEHFTFFISKIQRNINHCTAILLCRFSTNVFRLLFFRVGTKIHPIDNLFYNAVQPGHKTRGIIWRKTWLVFLICRRSFLPSVIINF